MNRLKSLAAVPALVLAAASGAYAAEDTTEFQVRMVIVESCEFSSAPTDIDFSTHSRSTGAPVTSTGTLSVNCSEGTPYRIGLDSGIHSESAGERRMSYNDVLVPYDLYQDSGHSIVWGDTAATDMMSATGTATNQLHTVYGRVPSTNFPAGTYTDTVTARVVY